MNALVWIISSTSQSQHNLWGTERGGLDESPFPIVSAGQHRLRGLSWGSQAQIIPITVNHFVKWTKQIPRNTILKLQMYSLEKQVSRFPQKRETAQMLQSKREYASLRLPSILRATCSLLVLKPIFPNTHRSSSTHTTATTDHMLRMSELGVGIRIQPPDFSDWYTGGIANGSSWLGGEGVPQASYHGKSHIMHPLPASLFLHEISWNGWLGQLWKKEKWSSGRHFLLPRSNWKATLLHLTRSSGKSSSQAFTSNLWICLPGQLSPCFQVTWLIMGTSYMYSKYRNTHAHVYTHT